MPISVATLLLVLAMSGCAVTTPSATPVVTIVQLATSPDHYTNKLVQVRACAFTGTDGTLIFDCADPGGPRFELEIPADASTPDTAKLVRESLGNMAPERRLVAATLIGQFQVRPEPRRTGVIVLKTIIDLQIDEP